MAMAAGEKAVIEMLLIIRYLRPYPESHRMNIKYFTILSVLLLAVLSCKKDQPAKTNPPRKVRYELFTNEDFSDDAKNILFSIIMRTGQHTIFDSPLAAMKIKEIPDSNHRIIIEKLVPDNDTATLVVGFNYQIENVGSSWFLDTFRTGNTFKLLRYSFR